MLGHMARRHSSHPLDRATLWILIVLGVGAVVGIGTAAALLARKDRPLPDDPDEPLFI